MEDIQYRHRMTYTPREVGQLKDGVWTPGIKGVTKTIRGRLQPFAEEQVVEIPGGNRLSFDYKFFSPRLSEEIPQGTEVTVVADSKTAVLECKRSESTFFHTTLFLLKKR